MVLDSTLNLYISFGEVTSSVTLYTMLEQTQNESYWMHKVGAIETHAYPWRKMLVSIIVATPVKLDKPGAQFVNWASP